jgi:hypothetical protein
MPDYAAEVSRFLRVSTRMRLSMAEKLMALYLLDIARDLGWPDALRVSNALITSEMGCSPDMARRAREGLENAGIISARPDGAKGYFYTLIFMADTALKKPQTKGHFTPREGSAEHARENSLFSTGFWPKKRAKTARYGGKRHGYCRKPRRGGEGRRGKAGKCSGPRVLGRRA